MILTGLTEVRSRFPARPVHGMVAHVVEVSERGNDGHGWLDGVLDPPSLNMPDLANHHAQTGPGPATRKGESQ